VPGSKADGRGANQSFGAVNASGDSVRVAYKKWMEGGKKWVKRRIRGDKLYSSGAPWRNSKVIGAKSREGRRRGRT